MAKCTVFKDHCSEHDFVHGAEAEELRDGIEEIIREIEDDSDEDSIDALRSRSTSFKGRLQRLLDGIDARDSLAFQEAQDDEEEAT